MGDEAAKSAATLADLLRDVQSLSQQSLAAAAPQLAHEFAAALARLCPLGSAGPPGLSDVLHEYDVPRLVLAASALPWPRDEHYLAVLRTTAELLNTATHTRSRDLINLGAVEALCRMAVELSDGRRDLRRLSGTMESVSLCLSRLLSDVSVAEMQPQALAEAANATASLLERGLQEWAGRPAVLALARLLRQSPPAGGLAVLMSASKQALQLKVKTADAYLNAQEALALLDGDEAVLNAVEVLRGARRRLDSA